MNEKIEVIFCGEGLDNLSDDDADKYIHQITKRNNELRSDLTEKMLEDALLDADHNGALILGGSRGKLHEWPTDDI